MNSPDHLDVRAEPLPGGGRVLHVTGELDLATATQLEDAIDTPTEGGPLVVDLTECTFLDSSGVRVLATTGRLLSERGERLALVVTDPGIIRILEITAVDRLLSMHPTLEAAL